MKIMERRTYPRITTSFLIRISPDIIGKTVDINEAGVGFILERPLSLSKPKVKIEFFENGCLESEAKVIWNKHLHKENRFRYGINFTELKKENLDLLREILIKINIKEIIDKINDDIKKQKILNFWLKDFKRYMNEFASLSMEVKNRQTSLSNGSDKLKKITNDILQKGDNLDQFLCDTIISKKTKKIFRSLCGLWAYQGKIVKRAFEKPKGYPGDYQLIEAIYNNKSISDDIGYCSDEYFLKNKYAIAVRNRKDTMKQLIVNYIYNNPSLNINILNIACGSCREIKEIFSSDVRDINKKICFTLVDQDEEALNFSKEILEFYGSENLRFKFLQHNILYYAKEEQKYAEILGKQDMIYSIGLADYLPDRILKKLISFCFRLLRPKGSLILAHKDITMHRPVATDWWCDWTFYSRDEKNLLDLIRNCEISNFNIKIEREKSNVILFLTITKQ